MSNSGSSSASASAGDKRKPDSKEKKKDQKTSTKKKLKNASGGASAVGDVHTPKAETKSAEQRAREMVMDEFRREIGVILCKGSEDSLTSHIWTASKRACRLYKTELVDSQLAKMMSHVSDCKKCQRDDDSDDETDDEENTEVYFDANGTKDAALLLKLVKHANEVKCTSALTLLDKQAPIADWDFAPPSPLDVCCCSNSHDNTPVAALTCGYLRKLVTALCGLYEGAEKDWQNAFKKPKDADLDYYQLAPFLMERATPAFAATVKDFIDESDAEKAKKKLVALFRNEYMKV